MTEIVPASEYRHLVRKLRKYRNTPTQLEGEYFASKKEAARYRELCLLERGKVITRLSRQPRFPLQVHGEKICTYVGDFEYFENGARVIEDTKGYTTREYVIKRKLMKAILGIEVRET